MCYKKLFAITLSVCALFSFTQTALATDKITVSPSTTTINEDRGTVSFTISLPEPIIAPGPDAPYARIDISSTDSRLTFSTTSISFSESEWAQNRVLRATSTEDFIRNATSTAAIRLFITSNSEYYSNYVKNINITITDTAPTITEIRPITEYTTISDAKYYFNMPDGCDPLVQPPSIVSYSGNRPTVENIISADTSVSGATHVFYLRGITVNGRYSGSFLCSNSHGNSNTLTTGTFTAIEPIVTRSVSPTASSQLIYGCKDTKAKNYNAFSNHDQSLCVYNNSVSKIKTLTSNLLTGMSGEQVLILQDFLISEKKGGSALILQKNGATGMFGKITKQALIEWQKAVGVYPITGTFGPKTRDFIQKNR